MGHPNLSPELNRIIDAMADHGELAIDGLAENTMFEVHTENNVYTIVVVDPGMNIIALEGTHEETGKADLFVLFGSAFGKDSATLRVGAVVVGLYLRFQAISGQLGTTSRITRLVILNDPEKAQRIRCEAEAKHPDGIVMTDEEIAQWQKEFDEKIAATFAGEHLAAVQDHLAMFCINGKCYAAIFLAIAQDAGKLIEALDTLTRHFGNHWMYKPPTIRGELISPSDHAQWRLAYQETDLPLPG